MTEHLCTPIGLVPSEFPFLPQLMKKARIGYEDTPITKKNEKGEEEKSFVRRWFILQDDDKVPVTRRKSTGRIYKDESVMVCAGNQHRKFCMIRDAVTFLCKGNASISEILKAAIGESDTIRTLDNKTIDVGARVSELWAMDWRECENALVTMGVNGYQERSTAGLPTL